MTMLADLDFPKLPVGGKVRFAVGEPAGQRTSTWMVIGGTGGSDVFVGARSSLSEIKFSLHASGRWRFAAATDETARTLGVVGDRVMVRFNPPPEMFPGWRRALTLVTTSASLRATFPERKARQDGAFSWWPAPRGGSARIFEVMICDPPPFAEEQVDFGDVAPVGSIDLPDGGGVVILTYETNADVYTRDLQEGRQPFLDAEFQPDGSGRTPFLFAVAEAEDDGHPMIYDLGNPILT